MELARVMLFLSRLSIGINICILLLINLSIVLELSLVNQYVVWFGGSAVILAVLSLFHKKSRARALISLSFTLFFIIFTFVLFFGSWASTPFP